VSTAHIRTSICAVCERRITLMRDGAFRRHGPCASPCMGSRYTPGDAETLILPPLTDSQLTMMRDCYRIGDWRPIEIEFGITFPQYLIRASTLDDELAYLIRVVRFAIRSLVDMSKAHADRRVP
jgi:hypothetical protein